MYNWSGKTAFRDAAVLAADWWLSNAPNDQVAYWDFNDPAIPATERDTSATAMAAAALLKLSTLVEGDDQRARYAVAGTETVRALVTGYLTPIHTRDERSVGILTEGCWQRNYGMATKHELIWGDYYLLESLLALTGRLKVTL